MTKENLSNGKETGQPDNLDIIPEPTHPPKSSRIINWIIVGALIIVAIGLLRIFTWSFDTAPVLTVNNSPFPVRIISDNQGSEIVVLSVDYCKSESIDGDLRMSFISGSREVFLPVTKERGPKGCTKTDLPIIVPKDLEPDTYKIKFRISYDKNPLKENEVVEFESQSVTIDPTTP